jgi:uncharacterized protein YbjT (DUF2867 family)
MAETERAPLTLLTGASGYVGGRLLEELERAGAHLRCLTRRPVVLRGRVGQDTEVVAGDVLDRTSLGDALSGVHTAYYLIHSMGDSPDFEDLDRRAAWNFGAEASAAGVAQIVYLGGLGADRDLSAHLASRHEVGQLLRCGGVPTLELRASIVIGSGSASFETVRALVERLPVIVAPPWSETLAQPIAIEEVLGSLLGAMSFEHPLDATYDIGGADQVTYLELMRAYARQRGLSRHVVRSSLITPRVARALLPWLTPRYGRIAAAMVDSARNETIVRGRSAARGAVAPPRLGVPAAIERTLHDEDVEFAQRSWSETFPGEPSARFGGVAFGRRLVASRAISVAREPHEAFAPIQHIGGDTGWYSATWFWRLRGQLDRLRGGVGLRRGRRDPDELRAGDAVDFWRVERVEPEQLLRLAAEMRLPGRLWLQFEVSARGARTLIRLTTVFDPAGYVGRAYWYALYPIHRWVFEAMLRGISRAAQQHTPPGSRPTGREACCGAR